MNAEQEDDPIKNLLKCTGWTTEDLLKRLEKYKSTSSEEQTEKSGDSEKTSETVNVNDNISEGHRDNEKEGIENKKNEDESINKEKYEKSQEQSKTEDIVEISSDTGSEENKTNSNSNGQYFYPLQSSGSSENEVTQVGVIQIENEDDDEDDYFEETAENKNGFFSSLKKESHPVKILNVDEETQGKETEENKQDNSKSDDPLLTERLSRSIEEDEENIDKEITEDNQKEQTDENNVECHFSTYSFSDEEDQEVELDENIRKFLSETSTCFGDESHEEKLEEDNRNFQTKSSFNKAEIEDATINKEDTQEKSIEGMPETPFIATRFFLMAEDENRKHLNDMKNTAKTFLENECSDEDTTEFAVEEKLDVQNDKKSDESQSVINKLDSSDNIETQEPSTKKSEKMANSCSISNDEIYVKNRSDEESPQNSQSLGQDNTEVNNSDNEINDENHSEEEPAQNPEKLEELRKNLMLQLSCLRTKKKTHNILQELTTRVVQDPVHRDILSSNENSKKFQHATSETLRPSSEDLPVSESNSNSQQENKEKNKDLFHQTENIGFVISGVQTGETVNEFTAGTQNVESEETNTEDPLYVQTDDLGFIISCVEGGVELDDSESDTVNNITEENSISHAENKEDSEKEDNVPNVLDEIRKIIHKSKPAKNKKHTSIFTKKDAFDSIENFNLFCSSTSQVSSKTNEIEETRMQPMSLSEENSRSNMETPEDSNSKDTKNNKSPFVSNTLEEFLTENSKLNVSYIVPKSGAEEGLVENYRETSPILLKKAEEIKDEKVIKPKNEEPKIKAKTLAEKRKLLEKTKLKEMRSLKKQCKPENRSYIILNNKKIWIKSKTPGKCLAKLLNYQKKSLNFSTEIKKPTPKKPSLLTDLRKKKPLKIQYKPGPLCKKQELQATSTDDWETEVKTLPKVILEVIPQMGKPIHPSLLHRLPTSNGEITEDKIEFALTALRSNEGQSKVFKFDVPYNNNQEKLLIRRKKVWAPNVLQNKVESNEDSETRMLEVSKVISGLLNYVEVKELEPNIIQEEKDVRQTEDFFEKKTIKISENISAIVKRPPKRLSKIDIELKRLSCKVLNVEIEESTEDEACTKSFCQLGCICNSLSCKTFIGYHCRKSICMFNCTCPKERSGLYEDAVRFPAGTDLLSDDTVNRIEDRAKRDLAKEEREFTQTVIHSKDKTIVVGMNKPRRATKTPKKYTDYFDNVDEVVKKGSPEKETEEEQKDKFLIRRCNVYVEKLDLSSVIPYCLAHNLYYCHCGGKAKYRKPSPSFVKPSSDTKMEKLGRVVKKPLKIELVAKEEDLPVIEKPARAMKKNPYKIELVKDELAERKEENLDEVRYSSSGRQIRNVKRFRIERDSLSEQADLDPDSEEKDSARTRPVPSKYKKKKSKPVENATENDFINNITESDMLKLRLNNGIESLPECDILKHILVTEKRRQLKELMMTAEAERADSARRNKRKQVFGVREEEPSAKINFNQAMQRRKKKIKSVFEGEIIVKDQEWLKQLGEKAVSDGYGRLLPWKALIRAFNYRAVQIWCMPHYPHRLLISKADREPPKDFIGIAKCSQSTEIITWILTGCLPDNYNDENLSFVLMETKKGNYFEIRGLCSQIMENRAPRQEVPIPRVETPVNNNQGQDAPIPAEELLVMNNQMEVELPTETPAEDDLIEIRHKDMNAEVKILYMKKLFFDLQELMDEKYATYGESSIENSGLYMWVSLPQVFPEFKWRMLYLNRDFAYMYFRDIKYSIKYTDLVSTGEIAKSEKRTIMLRNSQISGAYDHELFGIYFDPHYADRIFVGPYLKNYDGEDIETLRYINQSLVSSESFNRMQGRSDYKCGHWLTERPYIFADRVKNIKGTIDLTGDKEESMSLLKNQTKRKICDINGDESEAKKMRVIPQQQIANSSRCSDDQGSHQVISYDNKPIYVKGCKPRAPKEYNRFIITNIPHFGYLGAYQPVNASTLEVSWPFEKKVLQFTSANHARDFLQDRFSQLLQPVPETFRIQVAVLMHLDLRTNKPINSDFLSGQCICGDFGTYNIKMLSNEFCLKHLKIPKEKITKMFARRAQAFLRKKIEELAILVSVHRKIDAPAYNITNILESACKEIKTLEHTRRSLMLTIESAEEKIIEKMKKLYKMMSLLPRGERNIEAKIFNETIKIRRNRFTTNEVIEIGDSDDETNNIPSNNVPDSSNKNKETESNVRPIKEPQQEKIPRKVSSNLTSFQTKAGRIAFKSILKPSELRQGTTYNSTSTSNDNNLKLPDRADTASSSLSQTAVKSPDEVLDSFTVTSSTTPKSTTPITPAVTTSSPKITTCTIPEVSACTLSKSTTPEVTPSTPKITTFTNPEGSTCTLSKLTTPEVTPSSPKITTFTIPEVSTCTLSKSTTPEVTPSTPEITTFTIPEVSTCTLSKTTTAANVTTSSKNSKGTYSSTKKELPSLNPIKTFLPSKNRSLKTLKMFPVAFNASEEMEAISFNTSEENRDSKQFESPNPDDAESSLPKSVIKTKSAIPNLLKGVKIVKTKGQLFLVSGKKNAKTLRPVNGPTGGGRNLIIRNKLVVVPVEGKEV